MLDDSDILRLYKAGQKEEAFNHIVQNYGERLYWHIRRLVLVHEDADDMLQNTFVKAWGALEGFRGESGLYTWLYRIATNEALTFLNRQRLGNAFPLSQEPERVAGILSSDRNFDGDKLQLTLQQAIASLPPKQRAVFTMRYFDETPYAEMSKIFDTSESALKASYHFAAEKIKKNLSERLTF